MASPHSNAANLPRYVAIETDGGHAVWDRKENKSVRSFARTEGSQNWSKGHVVHDVSSSQAGEHADELNRGGETVEVPLRGKMDAPEIGVPKTAPGGSGKPPINTSTHTLSGAEHNDPYDHKSSKQFKGKY